jgi:hypothetical protein
MMEVQVGHLKFLSEVGPDMDLNLDEEIMSADLLFSNQTDVPRGSVLVSLLYLLYTADLPTSAEHTTPKSADHAAVLATESDPGIASQKLQTNLDVL